MTAEIRLGDWRDSVRGLATVGPVDHLITDTPFSPHVHNNCRTLAKGVGAVDVGFDSFTDEDRDQLCAVTGSLVRRWHIIFTDFESVGAWRDAMERHNIEFIRTGVWIKIGGMPQISGDRPAAGAEAIVIGHALNAKGKPQRKRWNGGGSHAVYRCAAPPSGAQRHPTQKPLELLERLILDFTAHGETIVDTHAGSGTTLCAAARRGRRAIGWELQPRWVRVARKRIKSTHEQLDWTDASQMNAVSQSS